MSTYLLVREGKKNFFFYERKKIRIAAVRLSMTPPKRALSPLEAEAARALQRKVRGVTYGGERGNIFDLETVKSLSRFFSSCLFIFLNNENTTRLESGRD